MNRSRGNDLFPVLVILTALLVVNTVSYRNGHEWGDDFSQYIYQAKSLVDGTTDRLLEVSKYRYDNSETKRIGPVLYPWGFPIILSPVYYLFGLDLLPMKVFTNLFFLLSLSVIFLLFKNRLGRFENYLVLIILGLNPAFFEFKDSVLSDIPFMFFCLTSIFFMQRFIMEKRPFLNEAAGNALIGASIFVSYAIRNNGIILIPTLFAVQIAEGLRTMKRTDILPLQSLNYLIPYGVFAVSVAAMGVFLPSASSGSYTKQLGMMSVETVAMNIIYYMILPSGFFTGNVPAPFDTVGTILFLVSVPPTLIGLARNFKESYHYVVFSLLTVLLYIFWPGTQGLRFIFPVLPFYLFYLFSGLGRMKLALSLKRYRAIPLTAVFGSTVIVFFGLTISSQVYAVLGSSGQDVLEGPYTKESIELFRYISDHTRSSDIVIFYKPRAMALYTQRKSIELTKIEGILSSPAGYIACRRNGLVDLQLQNHRALVSKVFENREFIVYRKRELPTSTDPKKGGSG